MVATEAPVAKLTAQAELQMGGGVGCAGGGGGRGAAGGGGGGGGGGKGQVKPAASLGVLHRYGSVSSSTQG